MKIQCFVCRRISRNGAWYPVEEIHYEASHGYCPRCAESAAAEIKAYAEARHPDGGVPNLQQRSQSRDAVRPDGGVPVLRKEDPCS